MKYDIYETDSFDSSISKYGAELGRGDMLTEMKDGRLTITFRVRDDVRRTSRFRLTAEETGQLASVLVQNRPLYATAQDIKIPS